MFEIKVQLNQEIPCLVLKGRLDGFGAELFEKKTANVHPESSHWIADFQAVDYMSSAGIRALLKKEKELRKKGGTLILFGMDPDVAKILNLTGLSKHFRVVHDQKEALAHITHLKRSGVNREEFTFTKHGCTFSCTGILEPNSIIDIWNNARKFNAPRFDQNSLVSTNLKELGLSFGLGGFGNTAAQAQDGLGLFVSLKTAAGVSPADGYCRPDFLYTDTPVEIQIYLAQASSFSGEPSVMIRQDGQNLISLQEFLESFHAFWGSKLEVLPAAWGFISLAEIGSLHASKIKTAEDLSL